MEAWRSLIRRAVARLEGVGLARSEWKWGGGTVLMLRYHHRQSRDIDLFIDDVQFLSYLSPRLNDRETSDLLGYSEQANYLRLEYPEGEIDFLTVAPVASCNSWRTKRLSARSYTIERPHSRGVISTISPLSPMPSLIFFATKLCKELPWHAEML